MCTLHKHIYKHIPGAQWDWREKECRLWDDIFRINICVHYTHIYVCISWSLVGLAGGIAVD